MSKKNQIFEAALKMFVDRGFQGSSTSEVAKEAGVSNGTLFHYFGSKEELIIQLHDSIKTEQIEFLMEGLDELSQPKERIRHLWKRAIDWAMKNKKKYHYLHQYKYSPYKKGKGLKVVKQFQEDFFSIVEQGIQKKELRFMPGDFVFDMTNASVYGMVEYLQSNPVKYRTPEFMKQSFDWFWSGLSN